ncbi:MAG: ribonuclease D, partial [Pseudomonadota bacterium]|nr:ribonuclease D [Pseudomonadota bacterium]
APKLIANVADLERIASDDNPDVKCMEGWRKDVFGAAAMDLKNGRLALASENDRILIIKRD